MLQYHYFVLCYIRGVLHYSYFMLYYRRGVLQFRFFMLCYRRGVLPATRSGILITVGCVQSDGTPKTAQGCNTESRDNTKHSRMAMVLWLQVAQMSTVLLQRLRGQSEQVSYPVDVSRTMLLKENVPIDLTTKAVTEQSVCFCYLACKFNTIA